MIFGPARSVLLMQLIKWLGHVWNVIAGVLAPLAAPLRGACEVMRDFGGQIVSGFTVFFTFGVAVLGAIFGPPAAALLYVVRLVLILLMPIYQVPTQSDLWAGLCVPEG